MINLTKSEAVYVRDALITVLDEDYRVSDIEEALKIVDSCLAYDDLKVIIDDDALSNS